VSETHTELEQAFRDPGYIVTVGEKFAAPKFSPCRVSELAVETTRLGALLPEITGASKLKPMTLVPTIAEIVTYMLFLTPDPNGGEQ
jgi:hypothetical protein